MTDFANIIALFQEGSTFFSGMGEYLSQLGLGTGELTAGGAAVALAVLWFVARVIRTVVTVLFAVCVLLLLLQLAGYVDLSSVFEMVQGWLDSAPQSV